MGARAIGPNQHVSGRCRSILEDGANVALRIVLESNTPLTVVNNIVEPFAEDAPQCDAAHRQLAVGVLGVTVLQVDDKQTIQTVIEKRHAFARLGTARNQLGKEPLRTACLERTSASCVDAQTVSLQAIRWRMVALKDVDFDVVLL